MLRLKNVLMIVMLFLIINQIAWSEDLPEIVMPAWGAVLTEEGNLIIFPLDPMTIEMFGYEYEVEIEEVLIPDFYLPHSRPNFFIRNILPSMLCAGIGLIGTAIGGSEESWQYAVGGSIGLGMGITISSLISRGYE